MKHVKIYEKHYFNELKKYLVFDIRNLEYEEGDFAILETKTYLQVHNCLHTTQLYSYCEGELSPKKDNNFRIFESDSRDLIKYESDSLQDCLDNLLLVSNAEKYNI